MVIRYDDFTMELIMSISVMDNSAIKYIFVMLLFVSCNVHSVEIMDLNVCRAMATDELRLECYNNITKELTGQDPVKPTNEQLLELPISRKLKLNIEKTDFGAWVVKEPWLSRDTGKLIHQAYVNANDEIKLDNQKTVRPSLAIQCFDRKMFIFIKWGAYLGTGTASVTHRFDNNLDVRRDWNIEHQGLTTTLASRYNDVILDRLWKSKTLIAGVRPFGIAPLISEFNLYGSIAVINSMRNNCR